MTALLRFNEAFGPFRAFDETTIPQFTVLTGENGGGKTQLLKALAAGAVSLEVDGAVLPDGDVQIFEGPLRANVDLKYRVELARREEEKQVKLLRQLKEKRQVNPQATLGPMGELLGKPMDALVEQEVEACAVRFACAARSFLQQPRLAEASMGFLRLKYFATRAAVGVQLGEEHLVGLAGLRESLGAGPPPWEAASQVLAPFGFSIEGPVPDTQAAETDLELALRGPGGSEVDPRELSGGEKCLVALALAQYTNSLLSVPRVMLLDECLAPLHPSVVARALKAIRSTFCEDRGVHVILTSHSPTLVALVPEESLRLVETRDSRLMVRSVSSDECVGRLTLAVPTLRFNPKNRRQILVEAQQDAFIYERLRLALGARLPAEISLEFIPSGRTKRHGSKERVVDLVTRLRSAGTTTAFGVVDWDAGTRSVPGILALADGKRYAIENVVLDPLLVAVALSQFEEGRVHIGGHTPAQLRAVPNLQPVVDSVCKAIAEQAGKELSEDKVPADYVGGLQLQLPEWVLTEYGHDYAKWVIAAFPELRRHRAGPNNEAEDKLAAAIAANFAKDFADWLPAEVLELLEQLSSSAPVKAEGDLPV